MDTCGFPKDAFFLHKALLDPTHFLHLLPHWNWPGCEGSTIRVEAYTNCKSVELFLNGKSLGRQNVNEQQMPTWDVPYHPGKLKAVAFNSERSEPAAQAITETTGEPKKLNLQIHPSFDARSIPADGRFSIPVTVSAVDSASRPVPTAHDLIKFSVAGPAIILGVGNGNPTSHEPDKASERSLFHGLAQVILQTTPVPGEIKLTASAQGVAPAVLSIHSTETQTRSVPPAKVRYLLRNWQMSPITPTRPEASATVMEQDMNSWDRIDPRTGPQPAWNRASGYAIYRATGKVPKILQQTGGRIVFPEIIGQAEAFLDGANVAKKSDASAAEFSIAFPAGLEQLTVTLILHAQRSPAGITRPVEFLPKT
jgi:beta-galactosidase